MVAKCSEIFRDFADGGIPPSAKSRKISRNVATRRANRSAECGPQTRRKPNIQMSPENVCIYICPFKGAQVSIMPNGPIELIFAPDCHKYRRNANYERIFRYSVSTFFYDHSTDTRSDFFAFFHCFSILALRKSL